MKPLIEPVVSELYFYPIKSFRGFKVQELQLDSRGALYDRQWMLVDEAGKFLTQRQMPQLAKIGVRFDGDTGLELSAAEHGEIDFGLNEHEGETLPVVVWKSTVPAFEVSGEVSEWLSGVLSKKVRLVRISDDAKREFSDRFPDRSVRFHDAQPLLVISKAAVQELERKSGVTLSVSRFRPNIIVDHVPAHAEDGWASFKADGIEFSAIKACARCKITTVHPLTGEVGEEPLKTLSTYRRQEDGKVTFGYYYAHVKPGRIKTGARVSPH